jgi:hypothetical protein
MATAGCLHPIFFVPSVNGRVIGMYLSRRETSPIVWPLAFACWLPVCVAHAQATSLRWTTPANSACSTQAQIEARLANLSTLHLVQDADPGVRYRIGARLRAREGVWAAELTFSDGAHHPLGTRVVHGRSPDCRTLDVAVAVVISTFLDGLRPVTSNTARRTSPPGAIGVGLGVEVGIGRTPLPRASLRYQLPLALPSVLEVNGVWPGLQHDVLGRGARFWEIDVGASLCPRVFRRRLQLSVCAGLRAGAIAAWSFGLRAPRRAALPVVWIGLEPQLGSEFAPGWVWQLGVNAGVLAVRPRISWTIAGEPDAELAVDEFWIGLRVNVMGRL